MKGGKLTGPALCSAQPPLKHPDQHGGCSCPEPRTQHPADARGALVHRPSYKSQHRRFLPLNCFCVWRFTSLHALLKGGSSHEGKGTSAAAAAAEVPCWRLAPCRWRPHCTQGTSPGHACCLLPAPNALSAGLGTCRAPAGRPEALGMASGRPDARWLVCPLTFSLSQA